MQNLDEEMAESCRGIQLIGQSTPRIYMCSATAMLIALQDGLREAGIQRGLAVIKVKSVIAKWLEGPGCQTCSRAMAWSGDYRLGLESRL